MRVRPRDMKTNSLRVATSARSILLAASTAAVVAACGSVAAPAGGSAASGAQSAKVNLVITVMARPGAKAHRWTLRCDPVGGNHPDAQAACSTLLKIKAPFSTSHPHMCPMIVAGLDTATVKGTFLGKHIDASFNRRGCGELRWSKVAQIFR
ncbi:MAG: SSI family serine proteinase inhibitor [Actinomycetota bacterium]